MSPSARPAIDPETAWAAVGERDSSHDGRFVFAVRTTGVYCRPSCPARRPNRANVEFFRDGGGARAAGYRACRRCRPDEPVRDPLAAARAALEAAGPDRVTLTDLARRVGLSPSHLQRRFTARFGLSPRQFQSAVRSRRLRRSLQEGNSVSRAGYDAGFGSSRGVYEQADGHLGMTPARFASGGAGLTIRYAITDWAFGRVLVAATDRGVCAVLFGTSDPDLVHSLEAEFPEAALTSAGAGGKELSRLVASVARRLRGGPAEDIPLDLLGTAFQEQVWRALREIPAGATESYREVARRIGRPGAVRAVATAIARNRLAVLIPCHRVVRADGSPGDYRWGAPLKRRLIDAERTGRARG
ncbi:MAG: bifunctional DNA-binding transcriptional regulator/O6-methylguanine-DNA methyltransferase Ada [Gemmatimonadales bacterium]